MMMGGAGPGVIRLIFGLRCGICSCAKRGLTTVLRPFVNVRPGKRAEGMQTDLAVGIVT